MTTGVSSPFFFSSFSSAIMSLKASARELVTSTKELKRIVRQQVLKTLTKVHTSELKTQSDLIFQNLLKLEVFEKSRNVSVYLSKPYSEVITTNIITYLCSSGKTCYIPRCDGDTMEMVKLNGLEDFHSLTINKWNIPEPSLEEEREIATQLDIILVPGVAFDLQKNRIGHGKGYYDKYIQKCNQYADEHQISRPKTVGLALTEQLIGPGRIPMEDTDQTLDYVITPDKVL
ncbi:hypothetical protein BDB01DRAFT_806979 [Pilobolus umbonatus]|nr:hypothetical protein BDB01DRAFT_806979 [Pilobolus umbonatus]